MNVRSVIAPLRRLLRLLRFLLPLLARVHADPEFRARGLTTRLRGELARLFNAKSSTGPSAHQYQRLVVASVSRTT